MGARVGGIGIYFLVPKREMLMGTLYRAAGWHLEKMSAQKLRRISAAVNKLEFLKKNVTYSR